MNDEFTIVIPPVLRSLDEYKSLPSNQTAAFAHRLARIYELADEIEKWVTCGSDSQETLVFINDLQLDVEAARDFPSNIKGAVSGWLIHTSWSFTTTTAERKSSLSSVITKWLTMRIPDLAASEAEFRAWISEQGKALRHIQQEFLESKTLASALAHYLATDIVLNNLMCGILITRLNQGILVR